MAEIRRRSTEGRWQIWGWRQAEMEAAARLGSRLAREGAVIGEEHLLEGERGWLKASPLAPRPSWRHAMRRWFLGVPPPRLAEYGLLSWMTERHVRCPLPLAGGALWRGGRPRFQFLVTRFVDGATTLRDFLDQRREPRGAVLDELAREVARLHALRFVHRDLYPRNVLVAPPEHGRRVVFLDAWRGGARPQSRGPMHDLGCLFLTGAELLDTDEQDRWLDVYARERAAQGRPVRGNWIGAARRARRAERARLVRRPERLRGRALPPAEWTPRGAPSP